MPKRNSGGRNPEIYVGELAGRYYDGDMETALASYDAWLAEVKDWLASINMPLETWQAAVPFDFSREFKARHRSQRRSVECE